MAQSAGSRVVSEGVLVVSAVRDDGFREILGVEVADVESEATYQELFRALKERGLKGVELVTSDEHKDLKSAIERHFRGASHQRCQFHYAKNLLAMVGFDKRAELAEGLQGVFAAPSREQALRAAEGQRSPLGRLPLPPHSGQTSSAAPCVPGSTSSPRADSRVGGFSPELFVFLLAHPILLLAARPVRRYTREGKNISHP